MESRKSNHIIRVNIIDVDQIWIRKITNWFHVIAQDIIIVGLASTTKKAIEIVKTIESDVILLDFIDPIENRYDGIKIVHEITKISNSKIIIVTNSFHDDLIHRSFAAGAVNYLSKSEINLIPDAIRSSYQETSTIEVLAKEYQRLKAFERKEKLLTPLSAAEREVMELYITGRKRKDIALTLNKTEDTIKNQVANSLKKLNIKSRKELLTLLDSRYIDNFHD